MARTSVKEFGSNGDAFRLLAERLKAHAIKPNIFGYDPHTKQMVFHTSAKKKRLYIGGNRSGKTTGGIVEDLWWCTGRHPYRVTPDPKIEPIRGRIISVDFLNGIEKIIKPELARWCPPSDLEGGSWSSAYDKLNRTLHFANGSFIEFMSYDQDLDKFAGTSRHFVHFDEEPPNDIYTENLARLVDTGGEFWITMTPVEGMTWVYDTLYEPGLNEESGIEVITVSMTENPYLNQNEVQNFLEGLTADERKIREEGKFVQMGGLVYKGFNKETHVAERFVPPKDWLWVASLDHGFNNPTAWLWHAVSPDGNIVTFFEHYQSGWTVDAHAKRVHEINAELGRPPDYYVGDPSIKNTDPITGTSIQEEYIKYGVPITLANNDVSAGINRVARYLKLRADGKPNLVITENCIQLIRELGRYRWKTYASRQLQNQNNAYEVTHKKDDHACDSLRYFIMSRPDLTAGMNEMEPTDDKNFMHAPSVSANGVVLAGSERDFTPYRSDYNESTQWEVDEMMGGEW